MSFRYSLTRSNTALSTTADLLTLISAAAKALRVWEISIGGMGTASTAQELLVARVSAAGVTGSGALTAVPMNPASPAGAFTNFTGWTTQPTVSNVLLRLPVNANGGIYRWVALNPESAILIPAGGAAAGTLSFRSAVGTGNVSFHAIVEEI
jgi:hypothetical protein